MKAKSTALVLMAALVALTLVLSFSAISATPPTPHVQLSSAVDQHPSAAGDVFSHELVDSIAGMSVSADGEKITVHQPGLYFAVFVPQVTFDGGKRQCYTAWVRLNGVDVDNSNIQWCSQNGRFNTLVQPAQSVACYADGDVIEWMHSASQLGIYADAITVPGQPLVPSAITTIYRAGDC